jgi:hypothetical protein
VHTPFYTSLKIAETGDCENSQPTFFFISSFSSCQLIPFVHLPPGWAKHSVWTYWWVCFTFVYHLILGNEKNSIPNQYGLGLPSSLHLTELGSPSCSVLHSWPFHSRGTGGAAHGLRVWRWAQCCAHDPRAGLKSCLHSPSICLELLQQMHMLGAMTLMLFQSSFEIQKLHIIKLHAQLCPTQMKLVVLRPWVFD